jgi:hypothetical protein
MDRHDRPHRRNRRHLAALDVESLETRQLPAFIAPFSTGSFWSASSSSQQLRSQAALVRHEYDTFVGAVKTLELQSQATPEEFRALRDDAREISAAACATKLPPAIAQSKAVEVSLQLDRSPLYGWAQGTAWTEISSRLTTNLASLDVPQPLIDKTLADEKAVAVSAGVDIAGFQAFTQAFSTLRAGEKRLPSNPYYHFDDPALFYTQHLRGFFRGWGIQKLAAEAQLGNDLRSIQTETGAKPSQFAVVNRDVQVLQRLASALPSSSSHQLFASYSAAFAQGEPTPDMLSQLTANLVQALGPAGTPRRIKTVDKLAKDAPAFGLAVGDSSSHVQVIVADVSLLVDAGGGESLNPFKVAVSPRSRTSHLAV